MFIRKCPVCDSADRYALMQVESWELVRCRECSMVYIPAIPDYQEHVEEFTWERTFEREKQKRMGNDFLYRFHTCLRLRKLSTAQVQLRYLLSHIRQGKLLDIGCGTGEFLSLAQSCFAVSGIEISPALAAVTQNRIPGVTLYQMPGAEMVVPPASFDVVTMYSYLEHEALPRQVLERVSDALMPNGLLLIKVPNYSSINRTIRGRRWCGYRFPDHCNYFTPQTISRLLQKVAMKILPSRLSDCLPTSDSMYIAAQKVNTIDQGGRQAGQD